MAQLFIDFDNNSLDAVPSEFTARWNTGGPDVKVIETPNWGGGLNAGFGDRVFRVLGNHSGSPNYDPVGYENIEIAGSSNDRIFAKIAVDVDSGSDPGPAFLFRASGTSSPDGYMVVFYPLFSNGIRVTRYDGGSTGFNSNIGSSWSDLGVSTLEFFAEARCFQDGGDTKIEVFLWDIGDPKPGSPTATYTHAGGSKTGWTGLGYRGSRARHGVFGYVGIGTEGDIAPTEDVGTGLAFTTAPTVTARTTNSYTIGGTLSANGQVFAVAVPHEAAAPSAAQIVAGQHAGGGSAAGSGSANTTASAPHNFSLVVSGSDIANNPSHDLHYVGRAPE